MRQVSKGMFLSAEGCAEEQEVLFENGSSLNCVKRFFYLGAMLGAAGCCGEASWTRVQVAWGQFKELAELLTRNGIPCGRRFTHFRA